MKRPRATTAIRARQWYVGDVIPLETHRLAAAHNVPHSNPHRVIISIADPWEMNWWR